MHTYFSPLLSRSQRTMRFISIFLLTVLLLGGALHAQTAHFTPGYAQSTVVDGVGSQGVAVDGSGNVYIGAVGYNQVWKATPSGNGYIQSILPISIPLTFASAGIAVDGIGNIYIAEYSSGSNSNFVMKEALSGGSYTQSAIYLGALPYGLAMDGTGNVYITDSGKGLVLKETLSAGNYIPSMIAFGLNYPNGVAVDGIGNVYIVDTGNNRVLKETLSGSSYTQSTFVSGLNNPMGVAIDGTGNVYIADTGNDRVLKETLSAGIYTESTIGSGLIRPVAVAVDGIGNVYIAGNVNVAESTIAQVLKETPVGWDFGTVNLGNTSTTNSLVFTFDTAGTLGGTAVLTQGAAGLDFSNAGTGSCTTNGTSHTYNTGDTCTIDATFTPKFAGTRYGAAILKDSSGSAIATAYIHGTGSGSQVNFLPGTQSIVANGLNQPVGVAVDASGNLYFADTGNNRVVKQTLSGGAQSTIGSGLTGPAGVAVDGAGNIFIADTGNNRVLKETLSAGIYTQSTFVSGLNHPSGVAIDGTGIVYIADTGNNRVLKETLSAGFYTQSTLATSSLNSPLGVAVDGSGNVYIADSYNQRVLKETLVTANGSYNESTLVTDSVLYPGSVAVDALGNVYIVDSVNSQVFKETPSVGGYVQSAIGSGLNWPSGIAVDGYGNVYIADGGNNRVLKEDFWDPPSLSFATTPWGSTSSDSPQRVTVENIGNAALSFPVPISGNNPSMATNFTLNSSLPFECPLVSAGSSTAGTLGAGDFCLLPISFAPTTEGSISGALVLTDNNLNATGPGYATQNIALSGKGTQATPVITWATPAAITYGTALSATQLNASSGGVAGTFVYSPLAGTTPAAGTNTLSVTFTPTDTTDYTTVTKAVSITVQDFSLPAAPAAVTVTAGQTATANLAVSAVSGFTGMVVFTCSVPSSMSEASCSATSAQITASGANSTLTVTTTGAHTVALNARPGRWMASGIGTVFAGFILLVVPTVKRRRSGLLALFILLLLVLGLMSCGGNSGTSSGSTGGRHTDAGTPAGTYSLTLTATSGTASHTMNVSVTVQ
jgi:sugar lactone lactonase YvrE